MAKGPLNAFVDNFAASMSNFLRRGVRINVVSPAPVAGVAEEGRVTAEMVADSFLESMSSDLNGHIFKVWNTKS